MAERRIRWPRRGWKWPSQPGQRTAVTSRSPAIPSGRAVRPMTRLVTRFRFLVADDTSMYGVTAAGALIWHPGWTETSVPPTLDGGRQIGVGWAGFAHLVAGGDGILYALTPTGELLWYRDEYR